MVSVCIATKNGAAFIIEQLGSILQQLNQDDEVIISDDGSADNTLALIRSFQDPRIRVLKNTSETGIVRNFEASLKASRGEYIFLADQDDVWLPGKVKKMSQALKDHDLVVSDCHLVDDNLVLKIPSFYSVNRSRKGFFKNLIKNSYMGCCMAFTKKLKERALPFPPDIPMHDFWIGMLAEIYCDVYFTPEALVLHRWHDSNATSSGRPSRHSVNHKIAHRYRMVKNLFIRKYYGR